jgi:hypothetical protein
MDDQRFAAFLGKNARQTWESLGVYVRLYSDLCTFYKQNPVAIMNLYKKTGGDCSGMNQREPSKPLIAWMMATVMRNAAFRQNWFQRDRTRKNKGRDRKKKKNAMALVNVSGLTLERRRQMAQVK